MYRSHVAFGCFLFLLFSFTLGETQAQDWTHYVRTAGHTLHLDSIPHIMEEARATHLYGIEVDNDITGRYESFLNPSEKLKAIKAMADSAHADDNRAYVYIAGLEIITANADKAGHTFYKDHPDWVQRNREGDPAIFSSKDAFWIAEGDEDVWISPYAKEWRKIYMERIRQIAATGIDGIYIDIPYWMTHFEGWENTWASFDEATVTAFKNQTGIDALKDFDLGDWNDPHFIEWLNFRIRSITDFVTEIKENIQAINSQCKVLLEIYPGLGEEVPRVGADNYQLSQVADVIAHEFNPGEIEANRNALQRLKYRVGMLTFRAFAQPKPSWMLSYSWDGSKMIQPGDAMKNLFVSQVTAGINSWDAKRLIMSESNDYDRRAEVYKWIKEHEKIIYNQREAISPVGIYFSPQTRNYFASDWEQSYVGMMGLLLQKQMEVEIITPRTLSSAKSKLLILPEVRVLSEKEQAELGEWLSKGKRLLVTGVLGQVDEHRVKAQNKELIQQIQSAEGATFFEENIGKKFYGYLERKTQNDLSKAFDPGGEIEHFLKEIKQHNVSAVTMENAEDCVVQIASVDGKTTVFLSNNSGLEAHTNAIPNPQKEVTVIFHSVDSDQNKIQFTPFLGKTVEIEGQIEGQKLKVKLPAFLYGAILVRE